MKKILLLEPNYNNKYPPLGLMKISAYHKLLGDEVVFFKGDHKDYILEEKLNVIITKFKKLKIPFEDWDTIKSNVKVYLKIRRISVLKIILENTPLKFVNTVENNLRWIAHNYTMEKKWDRIYITTLFTFYWKQTKKSIDFAKQIIKTDRELFVGGVLASLIPEIIEEETGLKNGINIITGLLDRPGILDKNKLIIDELTPDYSILETIDHKYPMDTGYLTFMTKGCTRTCSFCAVPKLEPNYKNQISIKDQIKQVENSFGDRKDLILMDNNVLGSPKFPDIIAEIQDMGFTNNSKFVEPNYFEIMYNHLQVEKTGYNKSIYINKIFSYLNNFGSDRIKNIERQASYYQLLHDRKLDNKKSFNFEILTDSFSEINEYIEKFRNKAKKKRYVDFNQGIDCRYVDEEKMKLLSDIPIRPMRIAFDHLSLKKPYENAVRLAAKYGIKELSNYILFNYKDKPSDFWHRLKINVDLHDELDSNIFSFPMKFIPLYGRASLDRTFIGKHWNKKFIRAIQCVLNVTKGVGMPGTDFFEKAFGKNIDEFFDILMLPEPYILYRFHFENTGNKNKWYDQYKNLNSKELKQVEEIVYTNNFFSFNGTTKKAVVDFIKSHYHFKMDTKSMTTIDLITVRRCANLKKGN